MASTSGAILLLLMIVMNAQGQIDPTCKPGAEFKCLVLPTDEITKVPNCTLAAGDCMAKVTITDKKGENLKFKTEIKSTTDYTAVGVSVNKEMKDTFAVACLQKADKDVKPYYLPAYSADPIPEAEAGKWYKVTDTGTDNGGIHSCEFEIIFPISHKELTITKDTTKVHILLAYGKSDATGMLNKHAPGKYIARILSGGFTVGGHEAVGVDPPGGPGPAAPGVTPDSGTGNANYLQQSWTPIFVLFVAVFSVVAGVSA